MKTDSIEGLVGLFDPGGHRDPGGHFVLYALESTCPVFPKGYIFHCTVPLRCLYVHNLTMLFLTMDQVAEKIKVL